MTCSRREANEVNFLALEALFPNYSPQAKVDGDTDTNPANHNDSRDLNVDVHLEPAPLPIFIGMCVSFSRHARPGKAYVNGMHGTVESWNSATPSVRVRTDTGIPGPRVALDRLAYEQCCVLSIAARVCCDCSEMGRP